MVLCLICFLSAWSFRWHSGGNAFTINLRGCNILLSPPLSVDIWQKRSISSGQLAVIYFNVLVGTFSLCPAGCLRCPSVWAFILSLQVTSVPSTNILVCIGGIITIWINHSLLLVLVCVDWRSHILLGLHPFLFLQYPLVVTVYIDRLLPLCNYQCNISVTHLVHNIFWKTF